jgi:hypothetical protein
MKTVWYGVAWDKARMPRGEYIKGDPDLVEQSVPILHDRYPTQ